MLQDIKIDKMTSSSSKPTDGWQMGFEANVKIAYAPSPRPDLPRLVLATISISSMLRRPFDSLQTFF